MMRLDTPLYALLLAACGSTTEGSPSPQGHEGGFDPYLEHGPSFAEVDGAGGHPGPDACLLPEELDLHGLLTVHYQDGSCGVRQWTRDSVFIETRCLDTHCLCLVEDEVACACDTDEPWCTSKSRSCCPEPFL